MEPEHLDDINQQMGDDPHLAKEFRENVRPRKGEEVVLEGKKLMEKLAVAKTKLRFAQGRSTLPNASFLSNSPARIVLCVDPVSFSDYFSSKMRIADFLHSRCEIA